LNLLVLGGTKFVGRAVVEAALVRGHEVSLFNRGQTNPELFPEAEKLRGDRAGDLSALVGREWDAVIDPSGYVPRVVRASAEQLRDATSLYVFISSISVYDDFSGPSDESAPLKQLSDEHSADELREDYANYGALKVLCEAEVRALFDDRATVIRPGLVVGPHDPTGRFTYWPHRIARGGDLVAPAPPERQVQFVDVRDLAAWIVGLCEARHAGTYNAVNEGVAWGELLETCRDVAGSDARFVWVPDDFLVEHEVEEWMGLPMWIADPEWAAMHAVDVTRAVAADLSFRPLTETVRATLDHAMPTDDAGLAPEREAELLEAWAARRS
jgi:2'-hydroxyisoflavone reductase